MPDPFPSSEFPSSQPPIRSADRVPRRVTRYVDGGVALVATPYTPATWRAVQENWWWHAAAMVLLLPVYPVVALVVWQRPSGQPFARRVGWAVLTTASALAVVGLPAFVRFSRRWYWWHRTQPTPDAIAATSDVQAGSIASRAATIGADLLDRIIPASTPRRGLALPLIAEPWADLRDEVADAAIRVAGLARLDHQQLGPTFERTRAELTRACAAAVEVAERASTADAATAGLDRSAIVRRLAELDAPGGRSLPVDDRVAARSALQAQLEVADRVEQELARLEGHLRRLAAQAGEAAARAEELVWLRAPSGDAPVVALTEVTDDLAAIRKALEQVDRLDLSFATG